MPARYRQTHWIGVRKLGRQVFDVNAVGVGGWIGYMEWCSRLVPWLVNECIEGASGQWWPTHAIEVETP